MGRLRFTPGTRTNSITHGAVTFSFDQNVTAGNFVDGPAWVVVPHGTVMLDEPTPAQTTYDGFVANGCMVNPVVGNQGYDQRMQWSSFSAGLVASTWPRAVQAGDVIVKGVSRPVLTGPGGAEARAGVCDSYGALFVLKGPPMPGSFAPAAVGWTGRAAPKPIVLKTSIADFVASLPTFDVSSISSKPSYAKIIEMLDNWCPAGQRFDLIYESLFPWGMGFTPTPNNYGRDSGGLFSYAALGLLRSDFTTEQKIAIATRLVSWGIQMSDPSIGSGQKYWSDGGHFQFHMVPVLLYLKLAGDTERIANFMTEQPGNFGQVFRVTQEMIDEQFQPHTDYAKPCTWRERPVTAVSGNLVSYEAVRFSDVTGDPPHFSPLRLMMKRKSDGATAQVTAITSTYIASINSPVTLSCTIDAQPVPPFAPGDTIWFEPPVGGELQVGDPEWMLLPDKINTLNPSPAAYYRTTNFFTGPIMFLRVIGVIEEAGLQAVQDLVIRYNKTQFPLANYDYTALYRTFYDRDLVWYNFEQAFWNAYWASIYFDPLT